MSLTIIPALLVWVGLFYFVVEALLERLNRGSGLLVKHKGSAIVRLLAAIGHRPPDWRDELVRKIRKEMRWRR